MSSRPSAPWKTRSDLKRTIIQKIKALRHYRDGEGGCSEVIDPYSSLRSETDLMVDVADVLDILEKEL